VLLLLVVLMLLLLLRFVGGCGSGVVCGVGAVYADVAVAVHCVVCV